MKPVNCIVFDEFKSNPMFSQFFFYKLPKDSKNIVDCPQ